MTRKLIIVKHAQRPETYDLPYELEASVLMSDEHYLKYVEKHGHHFTDALAECASKQMENADGSNHTWTADQVKSAMVSLGYFKETDENTTPTKSTYGDLTYLANMYYADLYPELFANETSCIKAAWKIANDIDGYDGLAFCRWTADIIGKNIQIDWAKYI